MQSTMALITVIVKNMVVLIQISQHEPSTLLCFLIQVFTVVKKHTVVKVWIKCGLGAVLQKNIMLASSAGCLKMEIACFFQNGSHFR